MKIHSLPNRLFRYLLTSISPRLNINFFYKRCHHHFPNLDNPQTLDEKIQWMKLHYYKDNALVYQCADKFRVRAYVQDCGLGHILNPLIKTYHHASEINWDELPDKFVLKWNFGCGGNVICLDKSKLDIPATKRDLDRFEKIKFHLISAEPQYDFKEKLILCEQFIETDDGHQPVDYKFYCFHGKAAYVLCCVGREDGQKPKFYFFDRDWNLCRLNRSSLELPQDFAFPKPDGIERLFDYAEILSKPFPFVRADFYLEKGRAFFGELTFTPGGGFDSGRLPATDRLFGDCIDLTACKPKCDENHSA